jgi:CheY-like chemotaxis protein
MIPTVLVIEDNSLNLELVRDVLMAAGMKVVERPPKPEALVSGLSSPGHRQRGPRGR